MTLAQKKALLVGAGILTADGQLAPHYQTRAADVKRLLGARKKRDKKVSV